MRQLSFVALLLIGISGLSYLTPKGWHYSGTAVDKYEMGLMRVNGHESNSCAIIKATKKNYFGDEYGLMMQSFSATNYAAKTIKLQGYMRTRGVEGWAGFFLRIDKEGQKEPLAFENMHDRPIKGTTNWTAYAIELTVPPDATGITVGAILHGNGTIYFDDLKIELGGNAIPASFQGMQPATTIHADTLSKEPVNMDFEL